MLMLKAARLIDPASRTDDVKDILIAERKIIKISDDLDLEADMIARAKGERLEVIDCSGLIAAPGLIDSHVHMREPGFCYKEDVSTAAEAAKVGGFTTIIGMANTKPSLDNKEAILEVIKKGRKTGIRVRTCANITKSMKGEELVNMRELREAGAIGFTDDGLPLTDASVVKEAMRQARILKMPLAFHEEDPRYVTEAGVNAGEVAISLGLTGADRAAEIMMVERDCKIALQTGCAVCIQHVSAKETVDLIRRAKRQGARVHAEATPHHFSLTEEAILKYGTLAKVNPPIRLEEDRLAIIEGLKDGTIDIIATDHAPHSKEEKDRDFTEAPSGMIGLETALSLGIMNLVDTGHLKLSQLINCMTYAPSLLYNLEGGAVKEDGVADVVVFDPNKYWTYEKTRSKSSNSLWLGSKLKGKVIMTICDGSIVYDARE